MKNLHLLFLSFFLVCLTSSLVCGQKRAPSKPNVVTPAKGTTVSTTPKPTETQKPLANADIIQMVKSDFAENIILNAIQTNETQFDVSVIALFELKNSGVSQKIIEAMQSTVTGKRQVQKNNPTTPQNPQPSPSENIDRNSISSNQALPVFGTINEIKDFTRVYISVENALSRERIVKALDKAPQYKIVNDPQDAQIFLEYKELSRDVTADEGAKDTRVKSQMNAVYIKNNKRIVAWSDTVTFVKLLSGGIGFRSEYNEIKLTKRFLKAMINKS